MIEAGELRLGNAVRIRDYILFVKAISNTVHLGNNDISDFIHDDFNYADISPVPLTPAILKKIGFDYDDSENDFILGSFRIAFHIHDGVIEYNGIRLFEEILPLHKFQNLYFALTNEELTLEVFADNRASQQQPNR